MDTNLKKDFMTLAGLPEIVDRQFSDRVRDLGPEMAMGMPLFLAGPKLFQYAAKPYSVWSQSKANNISFSQAWKDASAANKAKKQALNYLKDKNSLWQTLKNKHQFGNLTTISNSIPTVDPNGAANLTGKDLIKYNNNVAKRHFYNEAQQLIDEAKAKKMTGKQLKEQMKKIRAAMAKGDVQINNAVANGTIKKTSALGKASHWAKKKTGYYKVKGKLLSSPKYGARVSSGLRLAKAGAKGGALMAIIYGITEIPKIIDSFGHSSQAGTKQVVKSATNVATGVLGYAAGSAATGALAGSVCPGIGNIAGAVIGFVGGCIGGMLAKYAADKVADSITGDTNTLDRSEGEIARENETKKIIETPEGQENLLAKVEENAEKNDGFSSQEELEAYQNIINAKNQEIQAAQELDDELPDYDFTNCFSSVV